VNNQTVSIKEVFDRGLQKLVAKHAETESTKVGTLRAGNTGLLLGDGRVVGKCARLTYLRMKGIEVEEPDASRELMFAGGRGNEDLWIDVLKEGWDGPILREEQIAISWQTTSGITVTGRPDIVLCAPPAAEGQTLGKTVPVKGIELKLVSSLWTARDVGILLKPKMLHLLQAAHYSWQLGVPFELWYTSRADFAVMGWAANNFPRVGEPGSQRCEYGLYEKGPYELNPKTGRKQMKKFRVSREVYDRLPEEKRVSDIIKVLPFAQGYELLWNSKDQLQYRPVMDDGSFGPWTFTVITKKGIEEYYQLVAAIDSTQVLPARPVNLDADGQKGSYDPCNYCPLGKAGTCDRAEKQGLKAWTEEAKKLLPKVIVTSGEPNIEGNGNNAGTAQQ
jgi:hypothetical protein